MAGLTPAVEDACVEGKCMPLAPCVALALYTRTPLSGGRTLQDHWRPRCNDVAHLAEWAQLLADLWGAAPLESELLRRWEYQGGSLTADPRQQA
jgi:hypothetical protein